MRLLALVLFTLGSGAALAQEPDTLDARGYVPLAEGNAWEYRVATCFSRLPGLPKTCRTVYTRYRVASEPSGSEPYAEVVVTTLDSVGVVLRRENLGVRYAPESASVVQVVPTGRAREEPLLPFTAGLGAPFGPGDGEPWVFVSREGADRLDLFGTASVVRKSFTGYSTFGVAVHGVGFVSGSQTSGDCTSNCSSTDWHLTFAEVGGRTYGARAVAGEPPPPAAARLRASPNPARGWTTVEGEGVQVDVYDVLGRRVRSVSAAPSGPVRVETGDLPVGTYVVRRGRGAVVVTVR